MIERECEDTWRYIQDDMGQVKLAQLSSPDGEVWQVTEPSQKIGNRLKTPKIPQPGPVARLV